MGTAVDLGLPWGGALSFVHRRLLSPSEEQTDHGIAVTREFAAADRCVKRVIMILDAAQKVNILVTRLK